MFHTYWILILLAWYHLDTKYLDSGLLPKPTKEKKKKKNSFYLQYNYKKKKKISAKKKVMTNEL